MLASQLWVIVNEVARRWQMGGGGRGYLQLPAQSGCTLFVVPLTAVDFDLCAQSGKQSCFLCPPLPPPPHFLFPLPSAGRAAKCNQINKLPVVSEWRRETTTTDSYACSAFTLPIAAAASNCATVQQQRLCVWQQQQHQQWWACWMASNSKRCRP